ncbi:hypothetical protein [Nocardia asteroides]|uniref:hypothetical protein n=1 Tax=Nocardia asteroides TaxID=1824 RepID=UPI001E2BD52E|nr:hypothetical protein [Nocardia asteroides]UGT61931.1 hypothetical protein LTT61_00830 [Nocardia asteroides]
MIKKAAHLQYTDLGAAVRLRRDESEVVGELVGFTLARETDVELELHVAVLDPADVTACVEPDSSVELRGDRYEGDDADPEGWSNAV